MNSLDEIEINKGDIVVDCGANIGEVTQYFVNRGAKVYAFEPNPYAFKVLSGRFEGNNNVICINEAVSDHEGEGKLFFHEMAESDQVKFSTGSSMVSDKNNVNEGKFVNVKIIDLSDFVDSLPSVPKVLKIDIEGEEDKVLNKMIDNGTVSGIPYVFVETHEKKVPSCRAGLAEVRRKIDQFGLNNINLDWI